LRLSNATLAQLPPDVARPHDDRGARPISVVHFGPGAFHRAHQASYLDAMGLSVCAVSTRSTDVADALGPQDGLYTLVEQAAEPRLRVIGALREVVSAVTRPQHVLARLADPAVRFVTATVTEKGYGLMGGDLAAPTVPRSFVGWLVAGLAERRAAGAGGLVAISCDNLTDNGPRLGRAIRQFAEAAGNHDLARWIADEVRFPATMVDSITPATDDALRTMVDARLGLHDAWPVQREAFRQWVVEDQLGADTTAFVDAGVTVTNEVAAFERAKLRLLNGAHSTLAYLGLALGHETVAQAMADAPLAAFIERLMRSDIAACLPTTRGLDIPAYIDQVLDRFRNPAIVHRLSQIAWDGSQKLPFRLLGTIADALAAGRTVDRLAVGIAAWIHFVQTHDAITDPLAQALKRLGDVDAFLAFEPVFPRALSSDPRFREALQSAHATLTGDAPREVCAT
jgi:fructuronate reductase